MAAMRPLTLLLAMMLAMTACAMMPRVTVAEASSANDLANAAAAEERWADQLDAMTVDPVAIQRIGEEDDENRAMMELEAELDSAVEAEVSHQRSAQWHRIESEVRRLFLPAVDECARTVRAHADHAVRHRAHSRKRASVLL